MADFINPYAEKVKGFVSRSAALKSIADKFEEATEINFEYVVLGISAIAVIMLFANIYANIICQIIGVAYPIHESLRCLETQGNKGVTSWIVYWAIFSFLHIIENFLSYILYFVPFWYPLKASLLFWLFLPNTRGMDKVYSTLIKPLFKKHQWDIDEALKNLDPSKIIAEASRAAASVMNSKKAE